MQNILQLYFLVILIIGIGSFLYFGEKLKIYISFIFLTILSIFGVLGAKILGMLEIGFSSNVWDFSSQSLFGAFYLSPISYLISTKLLKIDKKIVSYYTAIFYGCVLGFFKIVCYIVGCCGGIIIGENNGNPIRFPSQIVESILFFLIVVFIIFFFNKKKENTFLYFTMIYTLIRFCMEFLRDSDKLFFRLSFGMIHSIILFSISLIILLLIKRNELKNKIDNNGNI